MAIDILKEVNRTPGYAVAAGHDIISGQPVNLFDSETVQPYAAGNVLGLALDDTKVFVLADVPTTKAQSGTTRVLEDRPSGDLTPQSLFFSDVDRGGKVAVAIDGGEFGLYDDGRGAPYLTTDVFAVNGTVYANAGGLVTVTGGGNPQVGICLQTPAADGELILNMRLA